MSTLDLAWSLHPLILLIRCIGIDLSNDTTTLFNNRTILKTLYAAFCFFLNVASRMLSDFYIFHTVSTLGKLGQDHLNSFTSSINAIINYANYCVAVIGTHSIWLLVVRPKWSTLMRTFQRFEHKLEPQFFIKLRWFSILCTVFVIILVSLGPTKVNNFFKMYL